MFDIDDDATDADFAFLRSAPEIRLFWLSADYTPVGETVVPGG